MVTIDAFRTILLAHFQPEGLHQPLVWFSCMPHVGVFSAGRYFQEVIASMRFETGPHGPNTNGLTILSLLYFII